MTKPILKLFRQSGSPVFGAFWPIVPIRNSKGNTFTVGVLNTWGWEKLAIFDRNRRLSRKRYKVGQWMEH